MVSKDFRIYTGLHQVCWPKTHPHTSLKQFCFIYKAFEVAVFRYVKVLHLYVYFSEKCNIVYGRKGLMMKCRIRSVQSVPGPFVTTLHRVSKIIMLFATR